MSVACSTALRGLGLQPIVGIVALDEALDLVRPASRRRRPEGGLGARPPARARRAACGRPPPPARSRSRGRAAAGPSSRSRRSGPTARMSATVSTSSSFSRSGLCTMLAKSRMVLGSPMSRLKAIVLITRWCSISQATVSVSAAAQAEARAELARDARARQRVILDAPLGDVVQERRHVERAPVLDGLEDAWSTADAARRPCRARCRRARRRCGSDARPPCSDGTC